ncbi:hypothetical protein [Thermoplasma volcanium]|uniref:hypothetical protein n=1 Tax=Thermoplasma volcanium TaxID=50339 RepID=UPI0013898B07|nr:hypothetical protein [Thermoplasma volcanium]
MNIKNYRLREKYEELSRDGDRLAEMEKLVNWEGDQTTIPYSWSRYSSCSLYTIWLMRPWRGRCITGYRS